MTTTLILDYSKMSLRSLADFLRKQRGVVELIEQHQEALIGFDHAAAVHLYLSFCREMNGLMLAQENALLPLYERLEPWQRGGEPRIIHAEHRQIRKMMHDLMRKIETGCTSEHLTRRKVIGLIETEKTLKTMIEHHHQREEKYLYPAIERMCDRQATGEK